MSTRKDWFCIINPNAGKSNKRDLTKQLREWFETANITFNYALTEKKRHATELTIAAIQDGYRNIIAVGGDGTIHEVCQGIISAKNSTVILGVVPAGSGNDWIRTHRIPRNPEKAWSLILEQNRLFHDAAKVYFPKTDKHEYGINVIGMAYDAFMVHYIDQVVGRKIAAWEYLYFILKKLASYKLPKIKCSYDQESYTGLCYTLNIGVCRFSGGGMQLVPHADPHSGSLALTIAGNIAKWKIVALSYRLKNGQVDRFDKVTCANAKKIYVEALSEEPILVEIDGEIQEACPAEITIVPQAFQFYGRASE